MAERLKILILGANGRLGKTLLRRWSSGAHQVSGWGRAQLDLTNLAQIPTGLAAAPFDVVINTAGLTSVDGCEHQPQAADLANAQAPGLIAAFCQRHQRRLFHLSSDYVFAGDQPTPRTETDPTFPCNAYGKSKLAGEHAVLRAAPNATVLRVSWLFGQDKESFPDMILRTAQQQDTVSAVNDKWSSPSYADDLADWILTLIEHHPTASGIFHLCNEGAPTWQEYGQATLDSAFQLGLPLRAHRVDGHSMHGFGPFTAVRPPYTALATEKFTQLTGIYPRPWQDALTDYLQSKLSL
jgi:dTDP-4-dehydrorhamnose reductase